ncbi:Lecithin-cholesterol acyltransferase [Spironucleus salmonicida]|uniref:Lecithin-cholesterol acyltransferase n=1 Tax=Spironucleus salmonicida TaxID=348837 RepID=V6LT44_9EUKA|nr:Lecithin-cholesterol acyltransferase [Spironucleus salmonicida]|eukprot:EST47745.1 Lecithin:cholesterol acyltransferase family protein [Spironucleus salmonicida]
MKPLIIIPGIFGNILRNEHQAVWAVDRTYQIMKWKKLLINYLGGYIDKEFKFNSWTGAHIVPEVGIKAIDRLMHSKLAKWLGVTQLDYFDILIKKLLKMGYVEGKSLFIYTYDFRQTLLSEQQLDRFDQYLQDIPKSPIILAHSMGGLVVKYYQHLRPNWYKQFQKVISVCVPFDGINGLGLLVPTAGYDFNNKFLEDATRMIWAQSGMTAALLPSPDNSKITQCVYIKKIKYKQPKYKQTENIGLWLKVQIVNNDPNSALLQILQYIKKHPESVQYDIQYWISRFKSRFPTRIKIPYILPCRHLSYHHSLHVTDSEFFKPIIHDNLVFIKDELWEWEQFIMWGPSEKYKYPEFRNQITPNLNIITSTYNKFMNDCYINKSNNVPWIAKQYSLLDLYDNLTPEKTIESLVFGINKELYDAHYFARKKEISYPLDYIHKSIICTGIPTPVSCYYSQPIYDYQEIMNRIPIPIYGDGDGSVTATSQSADDVPNTQYYISQNTMHKDGVRNSQCIEQIQEWLQELQ